MSRWPVARERVADQRGADEARADAVAAPRGPAPPAGRPVAWRCRGSVSEAEHQRQRVRRLRVADACVPPASRTRRANASRTSLGQLAVPRRRRRRGRAPRRPRQRRRPSGTGRRWRPGRGSVLRVAAASPAGRRGRASRRTGTGPPRGLTGQPEQPVDPGAHALELARRALPGRRSARRATHGTTSRRRPRPRPARPSRAARWARRTARRRPRPSARSARSTSHDARKPAQSYRKRAVGAKTWMSPVQPSRSSRCGQSVGRSRKLPRMPQTTFSCSRFSSGSEHSNQPVRSMSRVARRRATTSAASSSPGHPSTSAYRKPWNVKRGLPRLVAGAGEHVAVGRRAPARSGRVPSSPSSSTSAWRSDDVLPRAPRDPDPQPAHQVLPEVEHGAARTGS